MNAKQWLLSIPKDLLFEIRKYPPEELQLLVGLNPSQLRAVLTLDGPVQINAVAGSGKTRVLTHRIAWMRHRGIKATEILCTTFTKKATEEMTTRLSQLVPKLYLQQITLGTTHSIGYRILAKEYENMGNPMMWAFKKRNILMNGKLKIFVDHTVKEIMNDRTVQFQVKEQLRDIAVPQLMKAIGLSKNEGIGWEEYQTEHTGKGARMEAYIEFYKRYELRKQSEKAIDGDDMLYLLWKLFKQHPEILKKYQRIYKYLLVDEAQDNNRIQYELIRMLGAPEYNTFVVGDDDQCQPIGTKVLVEGGEYINIEDLNPSIHKVVSYDKRSSNVVGLRKGYDFRINSRPYNGTIYKVTSGGKTAQCTPNHKWIVRWHESAKGSVYCVYMMRKDTKYRIGWCKLFKTDGQFNLGIRARNQGADEAWILKITNSEAEASVWESILSTGYCLPVVPFREPANTKYYTQDNLDFIFKHLGDLSQQALWCLTNNDGNLDYPIWKQEDMYDRRGGKTINEIHACNLIPGLMTVPVHMGGKSVSWGPVSIERTHYEGDVYSLDVDIHELYITEGLVTHNSMYGFRGAQPEEFINFTSNYKGATQIALEDNYRSNPGILEVANSLIRNNTVRLSKSLKAHKQDNSESVAYSKYSDENEEAKATTEEIKHLLEQESFSPKHIAILYRTNAQSRAMEDQLIMAGLPYVIHGGVSFYERKEVKDIVSYFQMAIDPSENSAFKRIYNVPTRYLGKAFFEKVQSVKGSHWDAVNRGLSLKGYEQKGVDELVSKVESLQSMISDKVAPSEILDWILSEDGVGYKKYILGEEEEEESSRMENIETLRFVLGRYEDISDFLDYIQTMTSKAKHSIDGVQLMTFHKSKGLEYPVAFNIGVSDGLLPHFRSVEDSESGVKPLAVEEERRLLYVGITRAEKLVYISSPQSFNGRPQPVSRFIDELGVVKRELGERVEG